jgi:hypothetical protein
LAFFLSLAGTGKSEATKNTGRSKETAETKGTRTKSASAIKSTIAAPHFPEGD